MHTHTHTHIKNGTRDEVREKWWLNNEQKLHKNSLIQARRSRKNERERETQKKSERERETGKGKKKKKKETKDSAVLSISHLKNINPLSIRVEIKHWRFFSYILIDHVVVVIAVGLLAYSMHGVEED